MNHTLKCWPAYYDAVASGSKTFELRLDDRGFQKGDTLTLCRTLEEDPDNVDFMPDGTTPRHELIRAISYTLHGPKFGLMPGYVILALKEEHEPH